MIVDPVTEYYDLVGSGHVSLYKTSPRLADDLKKYFIRCMFGGVFLCYEI